MKANFPKSLHETLRYEGGWSDHPKDPGGATMLGITLETFRRYRPMATKAELRAISDADVERIYRAGYADPVQFDALPSGMDHVAFDGAVNSGPSRGARWLQIGLGIKADGKIGKGTLAVARTAEPVPVIKRAVAARAGFLRGLKTWATFGKGWSRRMAEVEAFAVVQAVGVPLTRAQEAEAWADAKRAGQGATTGGAAGGGAAQIPDLPDWGLAVLAVATVIVVIILIGRWRHNRARAEAYRTIEQRV